MKNLYSSELYCEDVKSAATNIINNTALKNKSIMVTGATGLIGSFIVDTLMHLNLAMNYNIKIYAVGRSAERLINRFIPYFNNTLFHVVEHDINTVSDFDFHVDYLIHAASNSYPAVFKQDPVGTITANIIGTHHLLGYAKKTGLERFLFVSSGEVYGENEFYACKETDSGYVNPMEVRACYPASKRAAENLCVAYAEQYGMSVSVVRPCHIYGPNVTESDNRASVQFIKNALNHEDIVLKSMGKQVRSYCYIADCVSAILTVLLSEIQNEAYNIANSKVTVSIAKFAEIVAEIGGQKVVYDIKEKSKNDTPIERAVLDSTKLENLGWQGQYDIYKGIEHTLKIMECVSGKE